MRLFWFVFFSGGIFFYFLDQAFKVELFTTETVLNNMYHFFAGFIYLAWSLRLNLKNKLKYFILLAAVILFIDEMNDYLRHYRTFTFIELFYNLYLLLWGALCGYVYLISPKRKERLENQP